MHFFDVVENTWESGRFHIEFILREEETDSVRKTFLIKYGRIYRLMFKEKDSLTEEDAEILAMAFEFKWHDIAVRCKERDDWNEMPFLCNWVNVDGFV